MPAEKLKDDPIVEALLEIKFESGELDEVVTGRLSDIPFWKNSPKTRLGAADIPAAIRRADENLRFAPTVEVKGFASANYLARIGSNVLSIHCTAPYIGWETFFPLVSRVVDELYVAVPNSRVLRLGLRYVNVFTSDRHGIKSVYDLALKIALAETHLDKPINLNFRTTPSDQHECMTRIASIEFLAGNLPPNPAAAVDIDVSSPVNFHADTANAVKGWIENAHTHEKQAFLNLLPEKLHLQLKRTD